METPLINIVRSIDTQIANSVSFTPTFYEICTLQEKDGKTFPLQNIGSGQGRKISWDDKYPMVLYHRVLDVEKLTDPNQGVGSKPYEFRLYTMRLVGIGTRKLLTVADYEDNDQFCNLISDSIPRFITAKTYCEVQEHQIDKLTVYETEFANQTTFKDKTLEGIAFWIEYTIKNKIC